MSVLLITHDLAVAGLLCERIAVMYAGELVEVGTRDAVLYRSLHPYTDALLRARPGGVQGAQGSVTGENRLASIPGAVPRADDFRTGCRFQDRCERVDAQCREKNVPFEIALELNNSEQRDLEQNKKIETRIEHWIRCYHPVVKSQNLSPLQPRKETES